MCEYIEYGSTCMSVSVKVTPRAWKKLFSSHPDMDMDIGNVLITDSLSVEVFQLLLGPPCIVK